MRVVSIVVLALAVTLTLFLRCCEGAGLWRLSAPDDEEEFRPRPLYRDYLMRRARADDAFDDYGHLRFGRSDD